MKQFVVRTIFFAAIFIAGFLTVLVFQKNHIDFFYVKFTSPLQHSMIVGDSRSLQGIQPKIFDERLQGFEGKMFNFSFTIAQAPYGKAYRESILRKLDKTTTNGLFIISVNPFELAEREDDCVDQGIFGESLDPPNNMTVMDQNPNLEYVWKNFRYFHFTKALRQNVVVHDDGWLEMMKPPTSIIEIKAATIAEIAQYEATAKKWKPSEHRINELDKLIESLKGYGKVVLVRMPTSVEMTHIEQGFWKDFDSRMNEISRMQKVCYFDFSEVSSTYLTYDGMHLTLESGKRFSRDLCDSIAADRNSLSNKINFDKYSNKFHLTSI